MRKPHLGKGTINLDGADERNKKRDAHLSCKIVAQKQRKEEQNAAN